MPEIAPAVGPLPTTYAPPRPDFECPVCLEGVCFPLRREDDTYGLRTWMLCECGTLFQPEGQKELPAKDRSAIYKGWEKDSQAWLDRATWLKQLYFPLIEDMLLGRKVLEVRYGHSSSLDWMRDRGWLTAGIDDCPEADPGDHPGQNAAFLGMMPIAPFKKFDLIWLADSIQEDPHPALALNKAMGLLERNGLLFVSAPDTSFLHRVSPKAYGHWDPVGNRLMMRGEAFAKLAEQAGFETVLLRKSASRCGFLHNAHHWIGRKR